MLIFNFDLRSSLLTLGIINKFLLLSLNRSLQFSIFNFQFEKDLRNLLPHRGIGELSQNKLE